MSIWKRESLKEKLFKFEKELEEKEREIAHLLSAFNYYKKRTKKEIEEAVNREKERIFLRFIEVYENLQKAYEKIGDDGLEMILRQFKKLLAEEGVEEIKAIGKKFDCNFHHVVAVRKGEKEGTIIEEIRKGYMLNGKVIRPSYVVVSESDGHEDNRD